MSQDYPITKQFVYLGKRFDTREKNIFQLWVLLGCEESKEWSTGESISFKKDLVSAEVGQVWELTKTSAASWAIGVEYGPKFIGMHENQILVAKWFTLNKSATIELDSYARSRKEGSEEWLARSLTPIRNAMKETTPRGRRAILALVVDYLLSE